MRIFGVLVLGVAAALLDGRVQAAVPLALEEELEEVTISGKRLWQMREDLLRIEDRFFALYNELNQDEEFDVECIVDAPTGTRFKVRTCRPVYLMRAQQEEAIAVVAALQGGLSQGEPLPSGVVALERAEDYRRNVLAVINANPALLRLVREREALEKKFVEERRQRMQGRLARAR